MNRSRPASLSMSSSPSPLPSPLPTPAPVPTSGPTALRSVPDPRFDHAACGLLRTLAVGTIVAVNASFCDWVGYAPDALIAVRRVQELFTIGGRLFHQSH